MKIDDEYMDFVQDRESDIDRFGDWEEYPKGIDGATWVCYYKEDSLDARCGAAIVLQYAKLAGRKLHLVGINDPKNGSFLFKDLHKFIRAYIIGFSFPPKTMKKFNDYLAWEELFWADCNPRSREESRKHGYEFDYFRGCRCKRFSAAEQTWYELFSCQLDTSVRLLGRHARGDFSKPDVEPFYAALSAYPDTSVESKIWKKLLTQYYRNPAKEKEGTKKRRLFIRKMIENGKKIQERKNINQGEKIG